MAAAISGVAARIVLGVPVVAGAGVSAPGDGGAVSAWAGITGKKAPPMVPTNVVVKKWRLPMSECSTDTIDEPRALLEERRCDETGHCGFLGIMAGSLLRGRKGLSGPSDWISGMVIGWRIGPDEVSRVYKTMVSGVGRLQLA